MPKTECNPQPGALAAIQALENEVEAEQAEDRPRRIRKPPNSDNR
jgi:hypothetical protein